MKKSGMIPHVTKGVRSAAGAPMPELKSARPAFSIESETIWKFVLCTVLIILFALLQTTLFARFRPFGAVPDLMLSLTVAVAMRLRERWGAVFGLAAAFVIESIGTPSLTLLPLLYVPVGYVVGILTVQTFRDSFAVRALYTGASAVLRALFTIIAAMATSGGLTLAALFTKAVFPEFLSTVVFAILPHLFVILFFKPFPRDT